MEARFPVEADLRNTEALPHIRHSKARLVLLDHDFRIVLSEPEALRLLSSHLIQDGNGVSQLDDQLKHYLNEQLRDAGTESDRVVMLGALVLRLRVMAGAAGTFTAAFVEELVQREDLRSATKRYAFTRREVDVLRLILQGMTASEAADVLHISKTTVGDYFKSLLHKTSAKNRSEMVAKVLGWQHWRAAPERPVLPRALAEALMRFSTANLNAFGNGDTSLGKDT